jgi:catecholate siderophore receptor
VGNITDQWQIAGGYAFQIAEITKATTAAPAGATVASVPKHTLTLWNKYQFNETWGVGLGIIHRSKMYAAIDNTVTLPSFTRFDAAVYFRVNEQVALQLNLQNLFGVRYYDTANSNNNITPGAPRTAYLTLTANF